MILVIGGTQDGRELAVELAEAGWEVTVSVVSSYAAQLVDNDRLHISSRPLPKAELRQYLTENNIKLLIDASHPYAAHISQTAMELCQEAAITYLRYERQAAPLPQNEHIHFAADYQQAAVLAASLGKTIFMTTGSRNIGEFMKYIDTGKNNVIARVLPAVSSIRECIAAGLNPGMIVAIQGPFSKLLNMELYRKYHAEVMVTKNSGLIGGTDTKLAAALELGIEIVVIERPQLAYPLMAESLSEVTKILAELNNIK